MNLRGRQVVIVTLVAGFAYSTAATAGLYRDVFRSARSEGPSATIDSHVAVVDASSAEQIRSAVERAGWPRDADVSLVDVGPARLSTEDTARIRFSLGYLLYPRRIWSRSAVEAEMAARRHDERYIIAVGGAIAFPGAISHRVTPTLSLVELQ
jgi:hypothetical protein